MRLVCNYTKSAPIFAANKNPKDMIKRFLPLFAFSLVVFFASCDDDDPIIDNEEEVITRLVWTLTPDDAANETVTYSFVDTDGDGGNDPVVSSTGTLVANASYAGSVTFANEDEQITPEVMEEDDEHQVFYVVDGTLNLTPAYDDMDGDGNPLGLQTTVTTGDASFGNFTIILRHEPMKDAAATIGNPAAAGGETDIEVTFGTAIKKKYIAHNLVL